MDISPRLARGGISATWYVLSTGVSVPVNCYWCHVLTVCAQATAPSKPRCREILLTTTFFAIMLRWLAIKVKQKSKRIVNLIISAEADLHLPLL